MDKELKEAFEAVCKYTYEVAFDCIPFAYDKKPQQEIRMERHGIKFTVPPWERLPKGCGRAYYDMEKNGSSICFPFPINWIVAMVMMFWHKIKHAPYVLIHRDKIK